MKALLIMRYFLSNDKKIDNFKFDEQIKALEKLGYQVEYFGMTKDAVYYINGLDSKKLINILFSKLPIVSKITTYIALYYSVIKLLKIHNDFKFVYIRSMLPVPPFTKLLKTIKRLGIKIIIEIPTYPPDKEYSTDKRTIRKLLLPQLRYIERRAAKYVDLYTLIGEASSEYYNRPAINIENGLDIERLPVRIPNFDPEAYHFLALAKIARWHGYDRIIEGIKTYFSVNKSPNIVLHIVGPDGDNTKPYLINLVSKYGLENRVVFEGVLQGDSLSDLINKCDIGFASLGLYRINLDVASVLKIREYMARGLPFVYAAKDNAIDENNAYNIRIKNDESPVDIKDMLEFAYRMRINSDVPRNMRIYAEEKMTWVYQFKKILTYIDN